MTNVALAARIEALEQRVTWLERGRDKCTATLREVNADRTARKDEVLEAVRQILNATPYIGAKSLDKDLRSLGIEPPAMRTLQRYSRAARQSLGMSFDAAAHS